MEEAPLEAVESESVAEEVNMEETTNEEADKAEETEIDISESQTQDQVFDQLVKSDESSKGEDWKTINTIEYSIANIHQLYTRLY
jgi:hypothetical protein